MDWEGGLFRWRGEPSFDPCLHLRHQNLVAEPLPTLLRLVYRGDGPTALRRTGCVEDLSVGKAAIRRMNRGDRGLVLRLGAAGEVVHDGVGHFPLLDRETSGGRLYTRRDQRPGSCVPSNPTAP